ncbi:MAG: carboxypeptidase-like regulatory domain-containing protein, partial [Bryobacteraceae bacterium]
MVASNSQAQTSRGTVSGLVADSQKSVVPGASVELTALDTNVSRSTTTNEAGLYRFDAVDLGRYSLKVRSTGFQTFSIQQFEVSAAQVVTLDANLQLGEVQQVVEVNAEAVQLQAESMGRGKSIANNDIQQLPFANRNPVTLSLTAPGVVSSKYATPSNSFVVNGGRGRSNNFMIDGTDNNDISVAGQA